MKAIKVLTFPILIAISIFAYGFDEITNNKSTVSLSTDFRILERQPPIQLSEIESQKLLDAIDRGRIRSEELVKQGKIGRGDLVAPYCIIIKNEGKERIYFLSSQMYFACKCVFLDDSERNWLRDLFAAKGIKKPEQAAPSNH